ncbi:extracellular solute-binding protein [Paenibacillus spongiae]|uniref:Extracellular solute-binding protein n=1 Tax=Paenibacillus spongiae TaxID=2909671 RepID=A0ABY5S0T8_9BACL|nr:extracellular solute-binding protein [Paenibacillus spongiae]UVI27461.1 extracellular solute-binding protein [Paenibacillus spongiae]
MIRKHFKNSTKLTALSVAIAASVVSAGPTAVSAQTSPWDPFTEAQLEQFKTQVSVHFENLMVMLPTPAVHKNGIVMVPGKAFLEGIGYSVQWDAKERKLMATHPSRPKILLWENRKEAQVAGRLITNLPIAPYMNQQLLWIPLRFTAEAGGLAVQWSTHDRWVTVRDPKALPVFSVGTRADNDIVDPPAALAQLMKDEWKTDVRFTLIPKDYYREKVNILIAAGDPTSLMLLNDPYMYSDDLFQGIAIDITDKLQSYPHLKKLALDDSQPSRSIDDRQYGIPRPGDPHDAPFPALRQDWLNALGLEQPETMDELYEVLKLFVQKDPEGDGKDNTIGMTGFVNYAGLGSFSWVEHAFTGSPDRFSLRDGIVYDNAIGAEEKQALQWLALAYSERLIDRDFAVQTEQQAMDKLKQGKTGIAAMSFDQAASMSEDKKASWLPLSGIRAKLDSTPIAPWKSSGNGMYIVSSMSRVNPELLLQWLDRGLAMSESGEWEQRSELTDVDRAAVANLFGRTDLLKANSALAALPSEQQTAYENAVKQWRLISYEGKTLPQASGLWSTGKYSELNSKLEELKIRVITGEATLQDWDNHIAKMIASDEYKSMMKDLNQLVPAN